MTTTIFGLILMFLGAVYLFRSRKEMPGSFDIGLLTGMNVLLLGLYPLTMLESFENLSGNFYAIAAALVVLSLILGWLIQKRNIQKLSWLALAFPAVFFLVQLPEGEQKITAFTYVQVAGLGALFPLLVHFLSGFIANMSPPVETPLRVHKQLISLLLGLAMLGFLVIVSNFILGNEAIYLLAVGAFSTAIMFTGYNLNGQKSFPALVLLLVGILLFSQFQAQFDADLNLGKYQLFSGFFFGLSALFLSALCSQWAFENRGFFSKLLLVKAALGPLIFVFLSGFLFFVYEAFGGRMSLLATMLAASFALPLLNLMFENRAYGGISLIFGMGIMILPMLEHKKVETVVEIQSDSMESDLKKLVYVNDSGAEVATTLNDLSLAQGNWVIDGQNSIIEFKVHGKESVTDGFFQGFSGTLKVQEDFKSTALQIEIPVATISTYNKGRDKSIRKDEIFFDEDKFPVIQYTVSSVYIDNEQYAADGQFKMKGIQASVKTNFIFASKGTLEGKEVIVLEGSGALNRTQFGQSSDASIGDDVSFTFKAIFAKE